MKSQYILYAVILIVLVAGWFLVSPLFIDNEVNEAFPIIPGDDVVVVEMNNEVDSPGEGVTTIIMTDEEPEIPASENQDTMSLASRSGTFVDADSFHKGSGVALVIGDVLRFEKFEVTNGPDLRVYLATDDKATDFIDLGKLKGNKGDQNYDIPPGTDLEKYDTVLIWCRAFSVLFSPAELG